MRLPFFNRTEEKGMHVWPKRESLHLRPVTEEQEFMQWSGSRIRERFWECCRSSMAWWNLCNGMKGLQSS